MTSGVARVDMPEPHTVCRRRSRSWDRITPGRKNRMRVAAGALLAAVLTVVTVAEAQAGAEPLIKEGWAVLVCSVFSTASSVAISAAPADKALEPIGEWTTENK